MQGAYGVSSISFGGVGGNGAGQTIAILDLGDDTSLADSTSPSFSSSDLAIFDREFGLPDPPSFTKMGFTNSSTPSLTTTLPASNGTNGNDVETSLDVEWAHSMAPMANILLVEATPTPTFLSDVYGGLYAINQVAASMHICVVSMSFGFGESDFGSAAAEQSYDSYYLDQAGVVYAASTGDSGAYAKGTATITPVVPAASTNVLAVGGTSLSASGDSWAGETTWGNGTSSGTAGGGGGFSLYQPQPAYQVGKVNGLSTTARTYPDVSLEANPSDGVPIYDSADFGAGNGWINGLVGGTSLAAPLMAGIVAIADQGRALRGLAPLNSSGDSGISGSNFYGTSATLDIHNLLYNLGSSSFHDITSGNSIGPSNYGPLVGYDLATGIGSPVANVLAPNLGFNDGPSIGGLTASPNPVGAGNAIMLSASSVTDVGLGSSVTSVSFYRDALGQTATSGGTLVGTATSGSGGTWTLSNVSTSGLSVGTYTYYAIATDSQSLTSTPVTTTNTVQSSYPEWLSAAPGAATWDGTNLDVTGTATIIADPLAYGNSPVITVTGTLDVTPASGNQVHVASLGIMNGASTVITATTGTPTVLLTAGANALSIGPTGRLDVANNFLDVANGSLSAIDSLINQGSNGFHWTGDGITSSTAAADAAAQNYLTAIGAIQNVTTGATQLYATFGGATAASTDVLVRFTYIGDANLDGKVDATDYARIDNGYLNHLTGWFNGDFNYDGVINGSDYTLIDNAFNTQGSSFAGPTAQIAAPIAAPSATPSSAILPGATSSDDIFSRKKIKLSLIAELEELAGTDS